MVEIDTGVALQINHATSNGFIEIRMPLVAEPPEAWRVLLMSLAEGQTVTILEADGRSWIRVVLNGGNDDADAIARRLTEVLHMIEQTNRHQVEDKDRWSPLDDELQSWWANQG